MSEYLLFKQGVAQRRGWRCSICGKKSLALDLHHAVVPKSILRQGHTNLNATCNVLLACPGECHNYLDSHHKTGVALCIWMHGYDTVQAFVQGLSMKLSFSWHRGIESDEEAKRLLRHKGLI